jgi:hypothetical protein
MRQGQRKIVQSLALTEIKAGEINKTVPARCGFCIAKITKMV